jgi:hypothetical protein
VNSRSRACATPEERGADLRPDPPTLAELRAEHDFESEDRDLHEPGDGARTVDVCRSCGLEQDARDRGTGPVCPDEAIPPGLIEVAKRHDLLPETGGARTDSMHGVPSEGMGRNRVLAEFVAE